MAKHLLILFAISLLAIIWIKEISYLLNYLMAGYAYLSNALGRIIVGGYLVTILRQAFIFIMIPSLITLIPALIYWLVRRSRMPYLYEMLYTTWFITLTVIALSK
jgi:hypothetical protein